MFTTSLTAVVLSGFLTVGSLESDKWQTSSQDAVVIAPKSSGNLVYTNATIGQELARTFNLSDGPVSSDSTGGLAAGELKAYPERIAAPTATILTEHRGTIPAPISMPAPISVPQPTYAQPAFQPQFAQPTFQPVSPAQYAQPVYQPQPAYQPQVAQVPYQPQYARPQYAQPTFQPQYPNPQPIQPRPVLNAVQYGTNTFPTTVGSYLSTGTCRNGNCR